uniref:Protein FAM195B n=1 Tax=Cyprinus carpio TaxID=7962 RepID=A0A8C1U280_CYPCA
MTSSSTPRMHTYKRTSSPRSPTNTGELFTPAHEENVRFIHDTWLCVLRDVKSPQSSERNDRGPQEYVEKNPNPNLHCEFSLTFHTDKAHGMFLNPSASFSFSFYTSGPE